MRLNNFRVFVAHGSPGLFELWYVSNESAHFNSIHTRTHTHTHTHTHKHTHTHTHRHRQISIQWPAGGGDVDGGGRGVHEGSVHFAGPAHRHAPLHRVSSSPCTMHSSSLPCTIHSINHAPFTQSTMQHSPFLPFTIYSLSHSPFTATFSPNLSHSILFKSSGG